ncbi:retropepsin-like aspartic protease [Aspergillus tanneri]|uniref:Peptidase A2 domain-containing protein n=1 Tax=Aspergillus tanneri TaxID=1220188 RepID=A0A5M9ME81_9EURO|nr:uncharacterized protein ATNIH1004_002047 [Aspergillus tanneri]KAA8641307.1 hypothetical protein ATNIH1004_002047 [Aspergillus tanneri]
MVELQAQERTIPTCALIDSGCQALLISRRFADAHLPEPAIGPRRIVALDGHRIRCYGRYRLRATTQDCHGVRRTIERTFDVVDMDHYDAILGYPWLREANPNVDWELGTWEYRKIPPEKEVEIRVGSATIGEGVRIPAIYKEFEDVFRRKMQGFYLRMQTTTMQLIYNRERNPHTDQFTPCPKVSSQFCADILKQR